MRDTACGVPAGDALRRVIRAALAEARRRRHDLLTAEHLLLALARDAEGRGILEDRGADAAGLVRRMERFLEGELAPVPPDRRIAVRSTEALRRILARAGEGARAAGRTRMEPDDLPEAILEEPRCHAARCLGIRPDRWAVILHDDDITAKDFVVRLLRDAFHKPEDEAWAIMTDVHVKGVGACGVYAAEVAEARMGAVLRRARAAGFPLRCTMEER